MKEKLIELRKLANLTQEEFANKVGCSFQHISAMERGKSAVTIKTLVKFAQKLNINCKVDVQFYCT